MRWSKALLLALAAGLASLPGAALAQGRTDTLVVVTEVGPNMLDIHAPGANRPSYQAAWNIYDRLITFGSKTLKDGSRMYDYASLKPELADVDYQKIAAQVFVADQCREVMKSLGYKAPEKNAVVHTFTLGKQKTFDPAKPADYLNGFAIRRA